VPGSPELSTCSKVPKHRRLIDQVRGSSRRRGIVHRDGLRIRPHQIASRLHALPQQHAGSVRVAPRGRDGDDGEDLLDEAAVGAAALEVTVLRSYMDTRREVVLDESNV